MRKLMISCGLMAALGLTGCGQATTEAAVPPPPKDLGRQAVMSAGEEDIQSISAASVAHGYEAGVLVLKATGMAPAAGYTRVGFLPRIYPATPPGGIYEIDVVALKPAAPGAQTPTQVTAVGAWSKYRDDRVKGIKFMSKTNSVVAMLPPKAPGT
jgi:hypothetical protein